MGYPRPRRQRTALAFVSLLLTFLPLSPALAATATTFSGQATVVNGTVAGIPITLVDTGPVPATGGAFEATLVCYPNKDPNCTLGLPDLTNGMVQAQVLHAATVAQGNA